MARRRPHPVLDLFGEIPITWPEVAAWTLAVAGIAADSWRWGYYVRGWNVPEKIRQARSSRARSMRSSGRRTIVRRPGSAQPVFALESGHPVKVLVIADHHGAQPARVAREQHIEDADRFADVLELQPHVGRGVRCG